MTISQREKLTEPPESVTAFFGLLTLFAAVASAGFALFGNGSVGGFGAGSVCASQSGASYADSGWRIPPEVSPRPDGSVSITGTVEASPFTPVSPNRVLYGLTIFPAIVLWRGGFCCSGGSSGRRAGKDRSRAGRVRHATAWLVHLDRQPDSRGRAAQQPTTSHLP